MVRLLRQSTDGGQDVTKGTGKFLSADELSMIKKLASEARSAPVMTIATGRPTLSEAAEQRLQSAINAAAISHGLPGEVNYGVSPKNGEIIGWSEKEEGKDLIS